MTCPTCNQPVSAMGNLLTCREQVKYWRVECASIAKERDRYQKALQLIEIDDNTDREPILRVIGMKDIAYEALKGETQ